MNCALCVITIGGGLLIARKLGISDMVFAIWLSGFNTALAFFIGRRLRFLLALFFYFLTYLYLSQTGEINSRVIWGMTTGVLVFVLAYFIDRKWRLIPFQKVILPLIFLILATLLATAY